MRFLLNGFQYILLIGISHFAHLSSLVAAEGHNDLIDTHFYTSISQKKSVDFLSLVNKIQNDWRTLEDLERSFLPLRIGDQQYLYNQSRSPQIEPGWALRIHWGLLVPETADKALQPTKSLPSTVIWDKEWAHSLKSQKGIMQETGLTLTPEEKELFEMINSWFFDICHSDLRLMNGYRQIQEPFKSWWKQLPRKLRKLRKKTDEEKQAEIEQKERKKEREATVAKRNHRNLHVKTKPKEIKERRKVEILREQKLRLNQEKQHDARALYVELSKFYRDADRKFSLKEGEKLDISGRILFFLNNILEQSLLWKSKVLYDNIRHLELDLRSGYLEQVALNTAVISEDQHLRNLLSNQEDFLAIIKCIGDVLKAELNSHITTAVKQAFVSTTQAEIWSVFNLLTFDRIDDSTDFFDEKAPSTGPEWNESLIAPTEDEDVEEGFHVVLSPDSKQSEQLEEKRVTEAGLLSVVIEDATIDQIVPTKKVDIRAQSFLALTKEQRVLARNLQSLVRVAISKSIVRGITEITTALEDPTHNSSWLPQMPTIFRKSVAQKKEEKLIVDVTEFLQKIYDYIYEQNRLKQSSYFSSFKSKVTVPPTYAHVLFNDDKSKDVLKKVTLQSDHKTLPNPNKLENIANLRQRIVWVEKPKSKTKKTDKPVKKIWDQVTPEMVGFGNELRTKNPRLFDAKSKEFFKKWKKVYKSESESKQASQGRDVMIQREKVFDEIVFGASKKNALINPFAYQLRVTEYLKEIQLRLDKNKASLDRLQKLLVDFKLKSPHMLSSYMVDETAEVNLELLDEAGEVRARYYEVPRAEVVPSQAVLKKKELKEKPNLIQHLEIFFNAYRDILTTYQMQGDILWTNIIDFIQESPIYWPHFTKQLVHVFPQIKDEAQSPTTMLKKTDWSLIEVEDIEIHGQTVSESTYEFEREVFNKLISFAYLDGAFDSEFTREYLHYEKHIVTAIHAIRFLENCKAYKAGRPLITTDNLEFSETAKQLYYQDLRQKGDHVWQAHERILQEQKVYQIRARMRVKSQEIAQREKNLQELKKEFREASVVVYGSKSKNTEMSAYEGPIYDLPVEFREHESLDSDLKTMVEAVSQFYENVWTAGFLELGIRSEILERLKQKYRRSSSLSSLEPIDEEP